jgi:SAM-dependent methyltransferase
MRGVVFVGRRYRCPCCGWRLRAFVGRWGIFAGKGDGYCTRCNAKARHRRLWLYLRDNTNLFSEPVRLLEVGPWWSLSRRFLQMPNIDFVGLDPLPVGPQVTLLGDVTSIPNSAGQFDAILCIHVLEHVEEDRRAMRELYRVLKPGGWAIVSVPLQPDGATLEDPTITDPECRRELFGERGHVRYYGIDLGERLEAAGFSVSFEPAANIPEATRRLYGLREDENLFHCKRGGA